MFPRYKPIYFYSLEEILKEDSLEIYSNANSWYTYFKKYFPYAPIYKTGSPDPQELKDYIAQLMDLVLARYKEHIIFVSDSNVLTNKDQEETCLKLLNVIIQTYDKYASLFPVWESVSSNPLKKVEVSTVGKVGFNDTPQNGGAFADDNHRSNLTESSSTSSSDIATPVERYAELKKKFDSILFEWTKQFDKIFIEEANV